MSTVALKWIALGGGRADALAEITLSRPEVSNAFNATMIEEMLGHLDAIEKRKESCRAVIIRGAGKHFSAGADLEWMQKSTKLSYDENVREAETLSRLFARLYALAVPTIAVVHGAAFGGGVGLVACCDWAIAEEGARFCLSEVKVGLVAAVILPYLATRMPPGELRRLVMTAQVFGAEEAKTAGLVQRVAARGALGELVRSELSQVLAGEPNIQRIFKKNHQRILEGAAWHEHEATGIETIARARVSETGQAGIRAFLTKQPPGWVAELPEEWKWE